MEQEIVDELELLRATPSRLRAALKGVSRKLALWSPAPGKWSIQEIACHMRDMERDAYLARYRRILSEDNPALPDIDGDVYALEGSYRGDRLPAVLRDWVRLRKECLALLKTVKGDAWRRVGVHETAGPLSMTLLLRRQTRGNDEPHLEQIEGIKRRFGILEGLAAGPKALRAATAGLSGEALLRAPAPGKWSALEVACHLRDVEQVFVERFTKAAHQERPSFWMMDNDRVAEVLRYREARLEDVLKEFARRRGETLTLLRALPLAAWKRTGLHPRRGEVSIEALALVLADHDKSHVERLKAR
jgi:DinB superfamily